MTAEAYGWETLWGREGLAMCCGSDDGVPTSGRRSLRAASHLDRGVASGGARAEACGLGRIWGELSGARPTVVSHSQSHHAGWRSTYGGSPSGSSARRAARAVKRWDLIRRRRRDPQILIEEMIAPTWAGPGTFALACFTRRSHGPLSRASPVTRGQLPHPGARVVRAGRNPASCADRLSIVCISAAAARGRPGGLRRACAAAGVERGRLDNHRWPA